MTLEEKLLVEQKKDNVKIKLTSQNCPSFSISRYIVQLLLPKCAMVCGEFIPSIYLQLSVNINHKKNAKKWQEEKCWMGTRTLSKITGYNFRTVHNALDILQNLDLVEKSYHGKLKMFQLKNHKLINNQEIYDLSLSIENKLLEYVSEEKQDKIKQQFDKLNSKLNILPSLRSNQLTKKIWFPNINDIRKQLTLAESTYKGSSLFFLNILSQETFKKQRSKTNNRDISEADRSLLIGCSQSTLNRYISAYENADIIKREKIKYSSPLKLTLNEPSDKQDEDQNNTKKRVIEVMEDKSFICSVCDNSFRTQRALSMHITKSQDEDHINLKKSKQSSNSNQSKISSKTKTPIVNVEKNLEDKYMSIPCECTMSCKSCFKNWKTDFFDDCGHERKSAFIEEYQLNEKSEKPEKAKKQKRVKTEKEETGYENIPTVRKGPSPDTAPGLVKYFYDLTGSMSPNWSKESKQIKNLLSNKVKPLTPDEVRIVLSYMARKGNLDLRFLSNCVNDALLEQKYKEEMNEEGKASYLLKSFYEGHGLKINPQTFIREVQRIQETMNSGLSYEDTKTVIDYMVATKCTIINFIGSKRNEALLNKQNPNNLVNVVQKTANNTLKSNPSFYDQDDLTIIRDELLGGRIHIKKVGAELKDEVIKLASSMFKSGSFNQKFTSFEWAWRIGLELDAEMYDIAMKDMDKETSLQYSLRNSSRLSSDKLDILRQLNLKFESWLQKQHELFSRGIKNS